MKVSPIDFHIVKSCLRSAKGDIPLMRILLKFIRRNFSTVIIYQLKVMRNQALSYFRADCVDTKYNHLSVTSGCYCIL